MQAATSVSILNALAALGVILAIPHVYRILDLLWLYFLRPNSVKPYLHGGDAPYAIVTGATDGIGKATAAELLKRGFNLILHGRNEAKMQKVVEELGTKLHITVVVHNVGGEPLIDTRIDERPEEYLLGVVRSNALFALFLTRALLPQLRHAAHSGPIQVLLVGSFACDVGPPRLPMYAASKGFLRALTRALSNDERFFNGAPTGVQFTYVSVGAVHSANHPAPMPPSLAVPTSVRFAWWLVEAIGCGRRHVVPYGLMRMSGERAVDEGMEERMRVLMEQAAKCQCTSQ